MQEKLQLLQELQGLDKELKTTRKNRQELENEQTGLDAELERVQVMVDKLADEIEDLQAQRRELTQALELEKENVLRAEGRLPAIKTQKEYVAVLKEIDTAKKLNKDIQDRILEKDREIESLNRDRAEKEAQLAAINERVSARRAEIEAALVGLDETLAGKGSKRELLMSQLAPQLRSRYQLLLERRAGVAVVEARNGACQGCNMHLPPQLYNSLFTANEVQSCPHCNRLLFVAAPRE